MKGPALMALFADVATGNSDRRARGGHLLRPRGRHPGISPGTRAEAVDQLRGRGLADEEDRLLESAGFSPTWPRTCPPTSPRLRRRSRLLLAVVGVVAEPLKWTATGWKTRCTAGLQPCIRRRIVGPALHRLEGVAAIKAVLVDGHGTPNRVPKHPHCATTIAGRLQARPAVGGLSRPGCGGTVQRGTAPALISVPDARSIRAQAGGDDRGRPAARHASRATRSRRRYGRSDGGRCPCAATVPQRSVARDGPVDKPP